MATKLQIINNALTFLGNNPVATLNLQNTVLQAMSSIYDLILPDIMAGHPWHFALRWEQLVEDPTEPLNPRWNYSYHLPADYIQAWNTYPYGNYNIVYGKYIWANVSPPWKWGYIGTVSEAEFPGYFNLLLSYALASECALLVTENPNIATYWQQKASQQRVIAQNRDYTAQPNPTLISNPVWNSHWIPGGE
jgi:hypothetical protein